MNGHSMNGHETDGHDTGASDMDVIHDSAPTAPARSWCTGLCARMAPVFAAGLRDTYGLSLRDPGAVRAQQIGSIMRVVPFLSVANIVSAVGLSILAWQEKPQLLVVLWAAAIVIATSRSFIAYWRSRNREYEQARRCTVHRVIKKNAVLGALWAVGFIVFYPGSSPLLATATAMIGSGIIYGGLTMIAIPAATIVFVGVGASGAGLALLLGNMTLAAIVMPAFLAYIVIAMVVTFNFALHQRERIGAREEIEQHKEDIDMLLTDFQASERDWFWRVDANGRLNHVSPELARVLGMSAVQLSGRNGASLLNLVEDRRARRALIDIMRHPRAMRDIEVPVIEDGRTVWWSLSGYVLTNHVGCFEGMRGVGRDVTAEREERTRMSKLATSDSLTGLDNRFAFDTKFAKALNGLSGGPSIALHYLDLDGFKPINDTYGHPAGDELLKTVAERLTHCLRDTDAVARLGGDEFAVLQANVRRPEDAHRLAERIIDTVTEPYAIEGAEVRVGTSVGIKIVTDERDAALISEQADTALYRAKADGKGVYRVFSADMHVEADARRALEKDLRLAFADDDLQLRYQPVIDLASGKTVAAEALLYWEHPERGVVSPAEFVPLAEETGLIADMGAWVIDRACRDAATWRNEATVMVNLSQHQLERDDLDGQVAKALEASGLEPARLSLEISEEGLPTSGPKMTKLEKRLELVKDLGVKLGLDDFGTGATSLSLLRRGTFDMLKLDRTCLEDAMGNDADAALACTIAALASQLGIRTVVEGVESRSQLDWIKLSGWDWAQGYLLGRSKTAGDIADMLDLPRPADSRRARRQGVAA